MAVIELYNSVKMLDMFKIKNKSNIINESPRIQAKACYFFCVFFSV